MRFRFLSTAFDERVFLHGPASRFTEFLRALHIFYECFRGFRTLHFVGPCITVFGSARVSSEEPLYEQARALGRAIAQAGFSVMTGGGPGLMEAANQGAREAGGKNVGVIITIPWEDRPNPYLDTRIYFRYLFVRKMMLAKYSQAFIALPGGFGTLDELFEILALIQTKKMGHFPVILVGKDFWAPLFTFFRKRLTQQGLVDPKVIEMIRLTDSIEEAAAWATAPGYELPRL